MARPDGTVSYGTVLNNSFRTGGRALNLSTSSSGSLIYHGTVASDAPTQMGELAGWWASARAAPADAVPGDISKQHYKLYPELRYHELIDHCRKPSNRHT